MDSVTLHFDFSHLQHVGQNGLNIKFINSSKKALVKEHTPETRAYYRSRNKLLQVLPGETLNRFTHYVEHAEFSSEEVGFNVITYPSSRPGAVAGEIAAMYNYIPRQKVKRAVNAIHAGGKNTFLPAKLHHYTKGSFNAPAPLALTELTDYHSDANLTVSIFDTALSLVMQHPEIASALADVHYRIAEEIILADPLFTDLWQYLVMHPAEGDTPWYDNTVVKDPAGNVMPPAEGLLDAEGETIDWPVLEVDGQQVSVIPQYNLSESLKEVMTPLLHSILQKLKDTSWLKGSQWNALNGSTGETSISDQSNPLLKADLLSPEETLKTWTISNKTSEYGLNLYWETLNFDEKTKRLSFAVKNWPNRGLGVYCQFKTPDGAVIDNPANWESATGGLDGKLKDWFECSSNKKYLTWLGAGSVFFGIPVWAPKVTLSFPVPDNASSVNVLFGGLGVGNWDMDVDKLGLVFTSVVSYGVPALFSALSVGISSTQWYTDFFSKRENIVILVSASLACYTLIVGAANQNGLDIEPFFIAAGQFVTGILLSQGMKYFATRAAAQAAKDKVIQSTPVVGLGHQLLSMASAITSMIATTTEVLLSPATYTIEAKRSMQLGVRVLPDPTHGTSSQAPIWPKASDNYEILVRYEGNTSSKKKVGKMPLKSDEPIEVLFSQRTQDELPVAPGQKMQIIATIYSKEEWIVGQWTSGWMDAVPVKDGGRSEEGAIIERLVPLLPSTKYVHLEKLGYNGKEGKYQWIKNAAAPKATRAILNSQQVSELVNITTNNIAYKIGYCYRAGEQQLPVDYGSAKQSTPMYLLKTISALANPGAGMKVSDRGQSIQPYIAFDQFGPAGLFTLDNAESLMPDLNTKTTVPAILISTFSANGFTLPQNAAVNVVKKDAAWTIIIPGVQTLYQLRRQVDVIKVFKYPTPEFSPNNFYLDTRTFQKQGLYHLRHVDLNDEKNPFFDFAPIKSWGAFPMEHISAVAIHPNNYAIAISYRNNKIAIVQLPAAGMKDENAPIAIPLSGKGIREGLLQGPVAMTITADGRILVLEDINARIQAFDTRGNGVPCFKAELSFEGPTSLGTTLTAKTSSIELLQFLQKQVLVYYPKSDQRYLLTPLLSVNSSYKTELNEGKLPASLRDKFKERLLPLSNDAVCHCTKKDELWLITDPTENVSYDLRFNGERTNEIDVYRGMNLGIGVKSPGKAWTIADNTNSLHYSVQLNAKGTAIVFTRLSSVMKLKDGPGSKRTYLDISSETKGFIYVLSYKDTGAKPEDYKLDIYNPDGSVLTEDEGSNNGQVNAARFTVDQWRTLFTLNYEQMEGAAGRPEPTISQWIPKS